MIDDRALPDWSLCIPTLDRRAALLRTLGFALQQTCPPNQIVVVDASDDWEESRVEAERLLAPWPNIALDYVAASVRSSATQRNEAIALCRHEIVFLIDDDSFLFPTCAEEILKIYAADSSGAVVGVGATLVPTLPDAPGHGAGEGRLERKESGRRSGAKLKSLVLRTAWGRWLSRKVLLQSSAELFIRYDEPRARAVPEAVAPFDVTPVPFMPGSGMSVRRAIALAEPFDAALRFYAAFEDLDVAYRYARHGAVLRANMAHLHHFEVAGGRVKRKKLVIFQLLNMLVFLKRHANDPDRYLPVYRRLLRRRLFGETLKDILSGRLDLPQARGVMTAMRTWRKVWAGETESIDQWYPQIQQRLLDDLA
jgi:glycosyltransferase involved in cell wall biosynthesis